MRDRIYQMYGQSQNSREFAKRLIDQGYQPRYKRGHLMGFLGEGGAKFSLKRHFGIGIKELQRLDHLQNQRKWARLEERLSRLETNEQKRQQKIRVKR